MSEQPESASGRTNPETGLPVSAPQAAWPERVDTGPRQVSYRITVNAPAPELWALLANPHRHHEVDGSESVQFTKTGPTRLAVGDEFTMAMRKFGLPYTMKLVTTAADEDRVVEWQLTASTLPNWVRQPVIAHTVYRTAPTGGVSVPIVRFRTTITPICTGSIPKWFAMPTRMGAARIMIAAPSTIIPISSRATLRQSMMTMGLLLIELSSSIT